MRMQEEHNLIAAKRRDAFFETSTSSRRVVDLPTFAVSVTPLEGCRGHVQHHRGTRVLFRQARPCTRQGTGPSTTLLWFAESRRGYYDGLRVASGRGRKSQDPTRRCMFESMGGNNVGCGIFKVSFTWPTGRRAKCPVSCRTTKR